jgi:Tfp pilus assembly protein PilN
VINLLPNDVKLSYRYAQRNVVLRRWLVVTVLSVIGVGLIGSYGWLTLRQSTLNKQEEVSSLRTSLDKANLEETNKKVTEVSNSLKLAQSVLKQEILFSKLLKQMATALPDGTYLTGLNIAQISSGSGLDVTVAAADYESATQVQVNLADPTNQIFAKADIQNITCDSGGESSSAEYPCRISLRAQFSQNNPFLFINQKQVKS